VQTDAVVDPAVDRAHARAIAATNPHGIGVAYIGPPRAYGFDDSGWRGIVAVSDGAAVTETLIVARSASRNAPFDTDVLAATVERIIDQCGGLSHWNRPEWSGPVIDLEKYIDVELAEIFLP
jgi:hypothetical protein